MINQNENAGEYPHGNIFSNIFCICQYSKDEIINLKLY